LEKSTGQLAYEVVTEVAPTISRYGILVGPSFASELIKGMPTLIALSSYNKDFTLKWINSLQIPNFRIYGHSDVIGACAASGIYLKVNAGSNETKSSEILGFSNALTINVVKR
jgi:glycerol-3-phosphate dehydrogenase (NAD(P)+)